MTWIYSKKLDWPSYWIRFDAIQLKVERNCRILLIEFIRLIELLMTQLEIIDNNDLNWLKKNDKIEGNDWNELNLLFIT